MADLRVSSEPQSCTNDRPSESGKQRDDSDRAETGVAPPHRLLDVAELLDDRALERPRGLPDGELRNGTRGLHLARPDARWRGDTRQQRVEPHTDGAYRRFGTAR